MLETSGEKQSRGVRCAIYTRKSTEESLDQGFNTLQAQREAAEAFIRSQHLSGWTALPVEYNDGGFTGANLERPALNQLLSDIEAGKIDCVLVYKVDRLSRSLLDFARLMGLFERHGVSFVSVTQEFNTTTSLGRLTLNLLLSFAQFEREIISERTRDKLSAARKKGKWIGGIPVLGYDVDPRGGRLVVNSEEAMRVQEIFVICDQAPSLTAALHEVEARVLKTKDWTSRRGRKHPGNSFHKSTLAGLLRNVLYKGCISHKGTIYPGEQEPIIDAKLWERVNRKLALRSASQVGRSHSKQCSVLQNLVWCGECGTTLAITHTKRSGRHHTYYVCPKARQHRGCKQPPVSVQGLESFVKQRLESRLGAQPSAIALQQAVEQIIYLGKAREVTITLRDGTRVVQILPEPNRRGVRFGELGDSERIPRISKLVALAIKMETLVRERQVDDYAALASAGSVSRSRMSQIMSLTNLAPEIQEALLFLPNTGRGPDPITERQLRRIARVIDWRLQKGLFGELVQQSHRN